MKSLYSILGVSPDATPDQIEIAYAEILSKLKEGSVGQHGGDAHIKLVAAKEAYSVLSDPVARQRYNNKLFASPSDASPITAQITSYESDDSGGMKKILIVGTIILAGIGLYSYHAREREQLRIQHEREIQLKALQLAEEKQQQMAAEQEARLERQKQLDAEARERARKLEHERYIRESEARQQQITREEERRLQKEQYEKQRQEREVEMKRRQELAEAQQRAARDKRLLQQLELERYGRVYTR